MSERAEVPSATESRPRATTNIRRPKRALEQSARSPVPPRETPPPWRRAAFTQEPARRWPRTRFCVLDRGGEGLPVQCGTDATGERCVRPRAIGSLSAYCRSGRRKMAFSTLGLKRRPVCRTMARSRSRSTWGRRGKKGREGPEGREEAPQVDAPVDDGIKSAEVRPKNGAECRRRFRCFVRCKFLRLWSWGDN